MWNKHQSETKQGQNRLEASRTERVAKKVKQFYLPLKPTQPLCSIYTRKLQT